jgi:steroid delta-isomerase-like uncharacterized protein
VKKYLSVIPLVVLLCFVVGCQDKAAMAELEAMKAKAKVEEQNEALYRGIIEDLNKGNIEFFDEFYAPDYAYYIPSNNPKPMTLEETKEMIKTLLRAFPDFNSRIEDLFAVEDRVIVRYIISGTHEGEWQGIPATGNKVEFSSTFIIRIENGKVVEEREDSDMLGLMQQLGMELKPKEEKK